MKQYLFVILFSTSVSSSVLGQEWVYDTMTAKDNVPLVTAEAGNPDGPAILFIHGYSQSLLSWKEQLNDPQMQAKFRMVAFDLRGHGASGKPWAVDAYESRDWGNDVAKIMVSKNLTKPVLVGWSFGASVITAYLREHGMDDVSGLVFVAGAMTLEARQPTANPTGDEMSPEVAEVMKNMVMMASPDIATNLAGTSAFVDNLAAVSLSEDLVKETLVYNMMLPAYVRTAMAQNQSSYEGLAGKITLPTLFIHGDIDALIGFEQSTKNQSLIPGSDFIKYEGIGHAPFLEAPVKFNADVSRFVLTHVNTSD